MDKPSGFEIELAMSNDLSQGQPVSFGSENSPIIQIVKVGENIEKTSERFSWILENAVFGKSYSGLINNDTF